MTATIGARLKLAREKRRLTVAEASEATKIRIHYVQALENDDLSNMPSAAQARGFLRLYAEFLGIGPDELMPSPAVAEPSPAEPPAELAPTGETTEQGQPNVLSQARRRLAGFLAARKAASADEPEDGPANADDLGQVSAASEPTTPAKKKDQTQN